MNELEQKQQEVTRLRVQYNFDNKYKDKGGWSKLIALRDNGASLRTAGAYFDLSGQRIARIYSTATGKMWSQE